MPMFCIWYVLYLKNFLSVKYNVSSIPSFCNKSFKSTFSGGWKMWFQHGNRQYNSPWPNPILILPLSFKNIQFCCLMPSVFVLLFSLWQPSLSATVSVSISCMYSNLTADMILQFDSECSKLYGLKYQANKPFYVLPLTTSLRQLSSHYEARGVQMSLYYLSLLQTAFASLVLWEKHFS